MQLVHVMLCSCVELLTRSTYCEESVHVLGNGHTIVNPMSRTNPYYTPSLMGPYRTSWQSVKYVMLRFWPSSTWRRCRGAGSGGLSHCVHRMPTVLVISRSHGPDRKRHRPACFVREVEVMKKLPSLCRQPKAKSNDDISEQNVCRNVKRQCGQFGNPRPMKTNIWQKPKEK